MCPVLFRLAGVSVYSYGFMLCLAFLFGSLLLRQELVRKRMNTAVVAPVAMLGLVLGLLGARLFDAFDHWYPFLRDPSLPSGPGAGATYLGGFLCALLAVFVYLRRKRIPVLCFFDAAAPGLMLAYGIARIGCQLSGDGDYGTPTALPWGMSYPNGTLPTRETVHPTPIYETLLSFVLFALLWRLRKPVRPNGWLFSLYLVLSGTERFLIEFIRLNPKWLLGLTQSQLISAGLVAVGLFGTWLLNGRQTVAFSRRID